MQNDHLWQFDKLKRVQYCGHTMIMIREFYFLPTEHEYNTIIFLGCYLFESAHNAYM